MEELVFSKVDEYLKANQDLCQCERCRLDICAIVLNSFPPKYIVSDKGEAYSRLAALNSQFKVDLVTAIIQAANEVKKNPRHS